LADARSLASAFLIASAWVRSVTILPYAQMDEPSCQTAGYRAVRRLLERCGIDAVLLLVFWSSARAQLATCYAGFETSAACITTRGLDHKVTLYQRKISEAMTKLGASYQIRLRVINNPVEAGYDAVGVGDVFTDVVRNDEMQNQSFFWSGSRRFCMKHRRFMRSVT
jgi:hypothetical protein